MKTTLAGSFRSSDFINLVRRSYDEEVLLPPVTHFRPVFHQDVTFDLSIFRGEGEIDRDGSRFAFIKFR